MPPKRKRATDTGEASSTTRSQRSTKSSAKPANEPEPQEPTAKKTKANGLTPAHSIPDDSMYSDQRFQTFFQTYADPDDPKVMGTGGIQRLFEEADLSLETVPPFLLAWTCKAAEFGAFRWEEWQKLKELQIDTPQRLKAAMNDLENALYSNIPISDDGGVAPSKTKRTPGATAVVTSSGPTAYNKQPLRKATSNPSTAFREFYIFCFNLMKKAESRVMEIELATATWSVVLQRKYPIIEQLLAFITEHPNYKAVNKDLWGMTLEFCLVLQEHGLNNWDDAESWPSLLDEFVAWEKKRIQTDSQDDVPMA